MVLDRCDNHAHGVWWVLQADISFVNGSISKHRIFHLIPGTRTSGAAADKARESSERAYTRGPFAYPWPSRIESKLRNLYEGHRLLLGFPLPFLLEDNALACGPPQVQALTDAGE